MKYNGCLKCHKPFVYQKSSEKALGCSFPIGTAYKPVTVMKIAAMLANYTSKVALVMPVNNNSSDPDTHLVAAVFPGVSNLVDYLATVAVLPSVSATLDLVAIPLDR